MYIDSHVHCRDEEQKEKETIAHALEVAKDSGLSAIFDIGNTNNPVTTRQRVLERFALAKEADSPVFYGTYILLTKDPDQIKEAVETHNEFFPRDPSAKFGVVGLKMFAGKSIGDCTIVDPGEQFEVDRCLVRYGYTGVKSVHCEKESMMLREYWRPFVPITHSYSRPEFAETISIMDQITHANILNAGFHLEIKHVSTPVSVELVNQAKRLGLKISCEAIPGHLLLDNLIMEQENGIRYKVNPPLRSPKTRRGLFDCFLRGEIDTLASDHAPYTLKEKLERDGMSGIPSLSSWPLVRNKLRRIGVEEKLIEKVSYENINKIFGTQIPRLNFPIKSHKGEYAFEPYEHLK